MSGSTPSPLTRVRREAVFALLGGGSGALAGLASYAFLESLDRVTSWRIEHPWLLWLLPVAGLAVGLAYHLVGGRAAGGTALAVSEAHAYTEGAPARMAPMVLAGTLVGHLFGASVGREGTAVQMSSSLTDGAARRLGLDHDHRAQLARAALAGGFGAVFGVPFAGVVFAMEVARRRTLRALVSAVPAAFAGDAVVRALGHHHSAFPTVHPHLTWRLFGAVVLAAVAFGLVARAFTWAVPTVKRLMARLVPWPPARLVVGALVTIGLVALVGRDEIGLSTGLLTNALGGGAVHLDVPALKLVFTVVALGCGFVGGEVTPLFIIGATLGATLASPLRVPAVPLAALGTAAAFGAAANVPLATTVMAVELFGWRIAPLALLTCLVARAVSGRDGIYDHPASAPAVSPPAGS